MLMKTTGRPPLGVAMSAPTTYPRREFTGTGMNVLFAVLVAPAIGTAAYAAVRVTCVPDCRPRKAILPITR
jgi:hypothetical protein